MKGVNQMYLNLKRFYACVLNKFSFINLGIWASIINYNV